MEAHEAPTAGLFSLRHTRGVLYSSRLSSEPPARPAPFAPHSPVAFPTQALGCPAGCVHSCPAFLTGHCPTESAVHRACASCHCPGSHLTPPGLPPQILSTPAGGCSSTSKEWKFYSWRAGHPSSTQGYPRALAMSACLLSSEVEMGKVSGVSVEDNGECCKSPEG